MGVKWSGMVQLQKALAEASKLEGAKKIVKLNGAELQEKAIRAAPYKTGALRRSIRLEIKDGGLTAVATATADYSGCVEYGTRFMRAQPFMRPSARKQALQFRRDIERLMK